METHERNRIARRLSFAERLFSKAATGSLRLTANATLNATARPPCLNTRVVGAHVALGDLTLSNTKVDIDLGPIHIDVGQLLDLITDLVPEITQLIVAAIDPLIAKALPSVVTKALPCVPLNKTRLSPTA